MSIETTTDAATITSGQSLSSVVHLKGLRLFAIAMPASWTAAALTFQVSYDGQTYADLYDDTGTEINFTVSASRFVIVSNPASWLGVQRIKIRSGTSGVPVVQGGDRILQVIGVA